MNLQLLDPNVYLNAFPEFIEGRLELGNVTGTAVKFNHRGTYFAVGCYDGSIIIYDFETRSIARELKSSPVPAQPQRKSSKSKSKGSALPTSTSKSNSGHYGVISTVSWFRDGRRLLTSSYDFKVIIWDLLRCKVERFFTFESAILRSCIHPKNNKHVLVCPALQVPLILDIETGDRRNLPVTKFNHKKKTKHDYMTAVYNNDGSKIYVGNSVGQVWVIHSTTLEVETTFNVNSESTSKNKLTSPILSIVFSNKGKYYLVNQNDKIRVISSATNQQEQEFKDVVSNSVFSSCCFSAISVVPSEEWDSDYVIASSSQQMYIWDRASGALVKMLEGPKENILSMEWHPCRPMIACSTKSGNVYIWSKGALTQNFWSAFAPDFSEIEGNETYREREDEYDQDDEINVEKLKKERQQQMEDVDVDILTVDPTPFDSNADQSEIFLPSDPIPDSTIEMQQDLTPKQASGSRQVKAASSAAEEPVPLPPPKAVKKRKALTSTRGTKTKAKTVANKTGTKRKKRKAKIETDSSGHESDGGEYANEEKEDEEDDEEMDDVEHEEDPAIAESGAQESEEDASYKTRHHSKRQKLSHEYGDDDQDEEGEEEALHNDQSDESLNDGVEADESEKNKVWEEAN